MTLLQAFILGIIQGITEFLPISSSAHLVLFPHLIGWQLSEEYIFPFNVLVQFGSLIAILYYFRDDLKIIAISMGKGILKGQLFHEVPARTGWFTLVATIPAGLVGLLIKDEISAAFSNPSATSLFLLATAIFLLLSEFIGKRNRDLSTLNLWDAIWIGLFQAISVFPGISRSGSTITGGMTRHFDRKIAGQFAFLMAIPILFAAGILGTIELFNLDNFETYLPSLAVGFITSAIFGLLSMRWLIKFISKHSLIPFAIYCFILGAGSLGFTLLNPQIRLPEFGKSDTTEIYHIAYESDLEWLLPTLIQCQKEDPSLQMTLINKSWHEKELQDTDLFFKYGEDGGVGKLTYRVGIDVMTFIVNLENGLETIDASLLQEIYYGRYKTWDEINSYCPQCFGNEVVFGDEMIVIYSYPENSLLNVVINQSILANRSLSIRSNIVPTSKAMKQAISVNKNGLGYLPRHWANGDSSIVQITGIQDFDLSLPILATSDLTPDPTLQVWLHCIQTTLQNDL